MNFLAAQELTSEVTAQVTAEVTEKTNHFFSFFEAHSSDLIAFGVKLFFAALFFFIGRTLIRWIRRLVRHSIARSKADIGVEQFIDSLLKFVLYAILFFAILQEFGVPSASVAAAIASGGVAISLALKESLSNLAGGVLILLLRPFSVGDYIREDTNGNEGTVTEIHIYYTKLSTLDNKQVVIPNGILANNSLTNVTSQDKRQLDIKIGISYQADLKLAKGLIAGILEAEDGILKDTPPLVFVDELGESAVLLGIRAWIATEEYWKVRWRLLETIKLSMDAHGITIPYPQMDVHLTNF